MFLYNRSDGHIGRSCDLIERGDIQRLRIRRVILRIALEGFHTEKLNSKGAAIAVWALTSYVLFA